MERSAGRRSPQYLLLRHANVALEPFHDEWIKFAMGRPRSMILAPRGHGKTTAITVGIALWKALAEPNSRTLIVSNTLAQAESFLREIKQRLETRTIELVFGPQRGSKWTESEITVSRCSRVGKEATITALGVMGAVISRHFDTIILDDVVDEENARTAAQRDKLRNWLYTTLMPTLEPHGQLIVLGTRYHLNDLYGHLANGPLKNDWVKYSALNGDAPLWPEKFSKEFLDRARADAGPIIFNAQYQNDVELMRGRTFREEWLRSYVDAPSELKVAIGVDLAIGARESSDYFALCAVGRSADGKFYVLEATRGRLSFDEQFRRIVEAYARNNTPNRPVVRVGVESVAYQEAMAQRLRRETQLPVVGVRPTVDKLSRASALTAFFETGRVFVPDGLANELVEELLLFPEGEHDDLFDALEMAITLANETAGYRDIFRAKPPNVSPV